MTLQQVRQIALALPETTEEPHFHLTSFRVRSKLFATAHPDGEFLHIFVSENDVEPMVEREPDFLEKLFWGKRVAGIRVLLPGAKSAVIKELLKQAWACKAPPKLKASAQI